VACPGIIFERSNVLKEPSANRVEMDVTDQLEEINILLTKYGLESILKEVSNPPMPPIKMDGVACQQAAHGVGERLVPGTKEKVHMIGHKSPGITTAVG
jgi:hypothetical protein